jgi:hypothetical protein
VAHVRVLRVDGGERERADDLVEERESAREAVGMVLRVRGGFVLGDDLRIEWGE